MSKKSILQMSIALSIIVAPFPVLQVHIRNASALGVTGGQQFVEAGLVPAGLQAAEWTHILERIQAQHAEIASLHASDAQVDDFFGWSVALSGDTLVVGAYFEDGGPGDLLTDSGAAYIFERDLGGAGSWGQAAILHASDAQEFDGFGRSVALSEDTLVVGAAGEDGGPGNPLPYAGAAYVFERDLGGADNWGEAAILHASDLQMDDYFGISVALSGDTLVVGAYAEDGGPSSPATDSGAAYVFERDLGGADNWGEAAILHASDAQTSDIFGYSVALSGNTLVVGAGGEDGGPGDPLPDSGAVYIFQAVPTGTTIYLPALFRP